MPESHYGRALARTLLGIVLIAILAIGVGLAAHRPHRTPPTSIPSVANPATASGAARIEWLTQHRLAVLEAGVAQDLREAQVGPRALLGRPADRRHWAQHVGSFGRSQPG